MFGFENNIAAARLTGEWQLLNGLRPAGIVKPIKSYLLFIIAKK